MHSDAFDVIPYEDIKGDWTTLGSGSFGKVYKGTYLGIDVAIKEVLPSSNYDVAKYFEREWRLMKEARHPNVVLYLGLSRAPDPDARIFIISEFIENGNLRDYIRDQTKPFPWRLRLSFATDIARALAYLHARKCIHRDLKGENLLVTANGRLKITDFGFARIAARNQDESKRLTFCGTNSYMSPEILLCEEFDLPTDIFSLGIIYCEIAARTLADEHHFKRSPPAFGIDKDEIYEMADSGCPPAFLALCLECLAEEPSARPTTRVILDKLRAIESDIFARPSEGNHAHVGSIKFMSMSSAATGKRSGAGPRIPSFGLGSEKEIRSDNSDDSDEELLEAVMGLEIKSEASDWSQAPDANERGKGGLLLDPASSLYSDYSTTVIPSHSSQPTDTSFSSILTLRPSHDPASSPEPESSNRSAPSIDSYYTTDVATSDIQNPGVPASVLSTVTFHTAHSSSVVSTAAATEGSTICTSHVHRFTLIKPGAKRGNGGGSGGENRQSVGHVNTRGNGSYDPHAVGWNPLDLFFSSGLLVAKCDVCMKRLGWKPILECDDCGLRVHVKCGEVAPRDCGIRPARPGVQHALQSISPLSKVKQNAKIAASVSS